MITGMRILDPVPALFMGIDHSDWSALGKLVAAKSLALITIVVIGLVAQFVFRRLIDRLVRRAEDGVLPDRLAQVGMGRTAATPPAGPTRRGARGETPGGPPQSKTA